MGRRTKKSRGGAFAYTLGLVASVLGVLTYLGLTPRPISVEIGPLHLRIEESSHRARVRVELLDGPRERERFEVDVPACEAFFKPLRLLDGDLKYLDRERWRLWQAHGARRR